ncbi:hypothetical protein ACA097_24915 [Pseudomonas sp. QL9]|uniref:hypothetical protein n=1 Tax=Pseudomonas sp. QL9 TaxID=3242725 RepID=UPI00352A5C2E
MEVPAAPRWKLRGLYGVILFSAGLIAVGLLAYREIASALRDPLQEKTISREKSTIHLLTLKNSPNSPAYESIAKQAMEMDLGFDGEAWLTVHVDRYRISCLTSNGPAVTEEVSVEIPLSQSLQLCQAAMQRNK